MVESFYKKGTKKIKRTQILSSSLKAFARSSSMYTSVMLNHSPQTVSFLPKKGNYCGLIKIWNIVSS